MIIDSSAIVAIVREEGDAERFSALMAEQSMLEMSAANYLETAIVIDGGRDPALSAGLDALLEGLGIAIAPVTVSQARLARQAYRDFGRGSGHPAKLNFGDCFAYALAVERGEPLLYKGDDFAHAGLARVVA
ncbi:MAG TPA: type II toxin-antitoxin system VapC family toxin [Allosphingosinicella sp.]|nr:type II toxin-antitoxin system VapC family toxin [Allosphingosinicella sp.]